jgi:hypothetical protein
MMKKWLAVWLLLILPFSISCQNKTIDVSNIDIHVNTYDFYKDFHKLDTVTLLQGLSDLQKKYPTYLPFYLDTLAVGTVSLEGDTTNLEGIKIFLTHKDYKALLDTVSIAFPSTEDISKNVITTLKYITYYDTAIEIPTNIFYAVSGLSNMLALSSDNSLTICLDYFLGENFDPYYQISGIPTYTIPRFKKEYAPIMVAQLLYQDVYSFDPFDKDLLSMMIEQGKMQYFLSLVTPTLSPNMRLGFTEQEYEWCEQNEPEIYNFFKSQELLFSKNLNQVKRFVSDGPFTTGMPEDSPGNIGAYIGYKIVKKYMDVTTANWHQLLQEQDAQKILKLSRYNP